MPFKFDKSNTYCISLVSNTKRWESMCRRFSEINLDVSRFEACTELDSGLVFADYLSYLQKCCSQSHYKLWKHILTTNYEYALIIEDDACFDKEWLNKLNGLDVKRWDAIFLNASEPESESFSWVIAKEQYLTGAYIVTRRCLYYLLETFRKNIHAADYMTTRLQKMDYCYTYFPWLVIQDGVESTIGSGVHDDHEKVKRCLNDINYSLSNYVI